MPAFFKIAGHQVKPGTHLTIDLPIPQLYTHTPMEMPMHIIHGKKDGPCLFVCAAVHGDEINGVEIIRRLVNLTILKRLKGTLIAIPVINVYGMIHRSRYLPDRRDLNRSFPGSEKGSLASRLADLLMTEVISKATTVIDLHTGAVHRSNLPQIRGNLEDPETVKLAHAFGVPVIMHSKVREGTLRESVSAAGIPIIVYEAGEALRLDELSIRVGVRGINNVMSALNMLPAKKQGKKKFKHQIALSSSWVRAPISGVLLNNTKLGASVKKAQVLGTVADPFGQKHAEITATYPGVVIGRTHLPLVNEGDALIHIAKIDEELPYEQYVDEIKNQSDRLTNDDNSPAVV